MKRTLRIVAVAFLAGAVGLTVSAAGSAPKKEGIVLGFSNAGMGDSWRQFLVANFNAEVAKHPEVKQAFITNADEKPEKQLADIDDLLVKKIDALIVYPTVADAVIPAIEKVYEKGIPVIVFGGDIATEQLTTNVKQDLRQFGRAQAKWLAEELKGKGQIVMLSGIAGNTTAEDRLAGAREAFKDYPGIKILDHQYCDWSPPKCKTVMEAMIQAHPKIDGIWADSGLESWPALQAMKEAGRPLVPSTGDQLNGYTKFLISNNVRGYAYPMTTQLSAEAVRQAVKAVKGEKVDKTVYIKIDGYGPDQLKKLSQPDKSDWWWVGDDRMPKEFLPKL